MTIKYNDHEMQFHLFNDEISYIIKVLPNKHLGHLYFGKRITDKESFGYLMEGEGRPLATYVFEGDYFFLCKIQGKSILLTARLISVIQLLIFYRRTAVVL